MPPKDLVPIGQVGSDGTLFANPALMQQGAAPAMPQGYGQPMIVMQQGGGGGGFGGIPWEGLKGGFMTAAGLMQRANLNRLQEDADKKQAVVETKDALFDAALLSYKLDATNTAKQIAVFEAQQALQDAQRDLNEAMAKVAIENGRSALYTTVGGVSDVATAMFGHSSSSQPMMAPQMQMMPMQMQPQFVQMAPQMAQPQQVMIIPAGGQGGGMSPALSGALAGGATAFLVNAVWPPNTTTR